MALPHVVSTHSQSTSSSWATRAAKAGTMPFHSPVAGSLKPKGSPLTQPARTFFVSMIVSQVDLSWAPAGWAPNASSAAKAKRVSLIFMAFLHWLNHAGLSDPVCDAGSSFRPSGPAEPFHKAAHHVDTLATELCGLVNFLVNRRS